MTIYHLRQHTYRVIGINTSLLCSLIVEVPKVPKGSHFLTKSPKQLILPQILFQSFGPFGTLEPIIYCFPLDDKVMISFTHIHIHHQILVSLKDSENVGVTQVVL